MTVTRTWLIAAAVAGTLALAGCTSSDGTGDTVGDSSYELPAEAQAILDEAMAQPEWAPPADSPAPAKDKFVIDVPCAQSAIGCSRPGDGFIEAAKLLGWKTQLIDPQGQPSKIQAAVKQAIQLDADGVFIPGGTIEAVGEDLMQQARDAGVAMVMMGGEAQPVGDGTWSARVNTDYGQTAPALAAYVANATNGGAKMLVINNSEFPENTNGVNVFKEKMGEWCPDCEVVEDLDFSIADIETTFPTRVKAALQANPDINYIYAGYDYAATQVNTVVQQLGLVGKVGVVASDGHPQNLQSIQDGVQTASFARGEEMIGWVAADQMNRIFNEVPAIEDARGGTDAEYPMQLLDESNLPDDVEAYWNAGIDYQTEFAKSWGLQ